MTGNRTVLNNTLNARDGRYPRATAPNNRVQPYIMHYNIITMLQCTKKNPNHLMGTTFFGSTSSQEKNICIRTLAETKRTIIIIIHILKYYNRHVPISAAVHNNILYRYTRRQNNNAIIYIILTM